MAIIEKIGQFKREHNVTILQVERWEKIIRSRSSAASSMGLREGKQVQVLRRNGRMLLLQVGATCLAIPDDLARNVEVQ